MAEPIAFWRVRRDEDEEEHPFEADFHPDRIEKLISQIWLEQSAHRMRIPRSEEDEEISDLKRRLTRIEAKLFPTPPRIRGEEVYTMLRASLEKEHFDKIVAIDSEKEDVAGIGDTVEEAYEMALKNRSTKRQFYFRRVGKDYIEEFG